MGTIIGPANDGAAPDSIERALADAGELLREVAAALQRDPGLDRTRSVTLWPCCDLTRWPASIEACSVAELPPLTERELRFVRELVSHDVRFLIVGLSAAALQGAPVVTQDVHRWFGRLDDPNLTAALRR